MNGGLPNFRDLQSVCFSPLRLGFGVAVMGLMRTKSGVSVYSYESYEE